MIGGGEWSESPMRSHGVWSGGPVLVASAVVVFVVAVDVSRILKASRWVLP
jgi:hypothetical protein